MRSKFTTFILFLVMIVLVVGIGLIGYYMYTDLFGGESEIAYRIDNIITEKQDEQPSNKDEEIEISIQNILGTSTSNEEFYYTENSISKHFYEQLNDVEKIIYNGLVKNKNNLKKGNYVINFDEDFSEILSKENGYDELGDHYQTAIEAFMHDNPDIFYIDVNKMFVNIKTIKRFFSTSYEVSISDKDGNTYLSDDFSSEAQVEAAIQAVESVKNSVLSKATGTDAQKVLYIHDYLVDNIEYDEEYNKAGRYSIYGALVGKKCVCEGYAKAFKYLLNSVDVECELMQGNAINNSGEVESHAWNCVKIKDKWYAVDITWEDPIVYDIYGKRITGKTSNSLRYKYFLKGTDNFEKDHTLIYNFSDGGKEFSYPTLSRVDY